MSTEWPLNKSAAMYKKRSDLASGVVMEMAGTMRGAMGSDVGRDNGRD